MISFRMRRLRLLTIFFIGATFGMAAEPYRPQIDPANFLQGRVTNPYFPLVPGTVWKYVEKSDGGKSENEVTVTTETKTILGVQCVVVRDTVKKNGRLLEDTFDWYAQDKQGTVWYFGEATKEYRKNGSVTTGGSWEAGINGQPGIIMAAKPQPGEPYRQEYSPKNAEDMGQVVAVNESVDVPAGSFRNCVKTKDWSLLESGSENKWYARGVGMVQSRSSGGETAVLMEIRKP